MSVRIQKIESLKENISLKNILQHNSPEIFWVLRYIYIVLVINICCDRTPIINQYQKKYMD